MYPVCRGRGGGCSKVSRYDAVDRGRPELHNRSRPNTTTPKRRLELGLRRSTSFLPRWKYYEAAHNVHTCAQMRMRRKRPGSGDHRLPDRVRFSRVGFLKVWVRAVQALHRQLRQYTSRSRYVRGPIDACSERPLWRLPPSSRPTGLTPRPRSQAIPPLPRCLSWIRGGLKGISRGSRSKASRVAAPELDRPAHLDGRSGWASLMLQPTPRSRAKRTRHRPTPSPERPSSSEDQVDRIRTGQERPPR